MRYPEYKLTAKALTEAKDAGIVEATQDVVSGMARVASRLTHGWANYRFEDFIMYVDEDMVVSIRRWNPTTREQNRTPIGPHEAKRLARMFKPVPA